jgi:hypothetical protein
LGNSSKVLKIRGCLSFGVISVTFSSFITTSSVVLSLSYRVIRNISMMQVMGDPSAPQRVSGKKRGIREKML